MVWHTHQAKDPLVHDFLPTLQRGKATEDRPHPRPLPRVYAAGGGAPRRGGGTPLAACQVGHGHAASRRPRSQRAGSTCAQTCASTARLRSPARGSPYSPTVAASRVPICAACASRA
eukprot:6086787-Prymnesium_polylepis.1